MLKYLQAKQITRENPDRVQERNLPSDEVFLFALGRQATSFEPLPDLCNSELARRCHQVLLRPFAFLFYLTHMQVTRKDETYSETHSAYRQLDRLPWVTQLPLALPLRLHCPSGKLGRQR